MSADRPPRVQPSGLEGRHWVGLDVFRGAAAALMVVNHAAVRAAPPLPPAVEVAGFVGSFAPVLFFFLTGFGAGVQSAGPARSGGRLLMRSAVLLAADAFLWMRPGQWVGMDFLGFIAVAGLVTHSVRMLPWSGAVAVGLAGLIVGLRYAVGPAVRPGLPAGGWARAVGFALGTDGLPGFSYPPAPWLAFPLIGYALGRLAARHREVVEQHAWRAAVVSMTAVALLAAVAAAAVARGAALHRWGTMSLAYFVAAWSAVGVGLPLAGGASERVLVRGGKWLGLSGVRSFAVVPLHYLLLAAVVAVCGPASDLPSFAGTTLVVLVTSFVSSAAVPWVAVWAGGKDGRTRGARGVAWAGASAAWAALALGVLDGPWDLSARAGAQLLLCGLLALPRGRRPAPATSG